MGAEATSVSVVDEDPAVLRCLTSWLRSAGHVVVAFGSADAFLASSAHGRGGCAVIDLWMSERSGFAVHDSLRAAGRSLPMVFLTDRGDVRACVQAMKIGAVDVLPKPVVEGELLDAVSRALERDRRERAEQAARSRHTSSLSMLTSRELEVCAFVAQGLLNKQIAATLGIAETTVKLHRAHGMRKLGVDSAVALARAIVQ